LLPIDQESLRKLGNITHHEDYFELDSSISQRAFDEFLFLKNYAIIYILQEILSLALSEKFVVLHSIQLFKNDYIISTQVYTSINQILS
jgi:hypothetical protein